MNTSLLLSVFFSAYVCASLLPDGYDKYALFIAFIVSALANYVEDDIDVTVLEEATELLGGINFGSKNKIFIGASLPVDTSFGVNLMNGINAAITSTNISGGVKNKKVELITKNDYQSKDATIENVKKLASDYDIVTFVSPVGIESTNAMLETIECNTVISPFTMHSDVRNGDKSHFNHVFNLAMNSYDVFNYFIGYFNEKLGLNTFGVFHENNEESNNATEVLKYILKDKNIGLVSEGTYESLTPREIDMGLSDSINSSPKVIFVLSDIEHVCLEYLERCRKLGVTSMIVFVSLHARSLVDKIPVQYRYSVYYCSNIPDINNIKLEISTKYKRDMLLVESFTSNKVNKDLILMKKDKYTSFYGYLVGKYIIRVMESIDSEINAKSFAKAAHGMEICEIEDYIINFFGNSNQAMTYMFMYEVFETTDIQIKYTPDMYASNANELFSRNL